MYPYHILIVDNEEDLSEILRINLTNEGYLVDVAYTAEEVLLKNIGSYNLFLLEVSLGEISGFKLAHLLRNNPKTAATSIIFLTTRKSENDILTGFSLRADDYITKPFSMRELLARMNAVLRRINTNQAQIITSISFDRLNMNLTSKQVFLGDDEILFTRKEFEILKLFIENKNHLFKREEILSLVWPKESYVLNRTVDVNITHIRKKIGPYKKNLVTKLGVGYYFET